MDSHLLFHKVTEQNKHDGFTARRGEGGREAGKKEKHSNSGNN